MIHDGDSLFHTVVIIVLGAVTCANALGGDTPQYSPAAFEPERYEHIWRKSPFVLETKIVKQRGGLADRFSLTGFARVAGSPVAWIIDRQSNTRSMISANPSSNELGIELLSVEEAPETKDSTAVVRLRGEMATLRFDMTLLQEQASAGAIPAAQGQPPARGLQRSPLPGGSRATPANAGGGDTDLAEQQISGTLPQPGAQFYPQSADPGAPTPAGQTGSGITVPPEPQPKQIIRRRPIVPAPES